MDALPIRLRARSAAVLAALIAAAGASALAPPAHADPGALGVKRAQVLALQAQLHELDARAGRIIEAFNGARWQLGVVEDRIRANGAALRKARADHALAQQRLADRLVAIYREGAPSLARAVLTAGSLSEALNDLQLLRHVEGTDRAVVLDLQASKRRIAAARRQLMEARRQAASELAAAARARAAIEAVLRERRALLARSQAELAVLEQIEARRQAAQLAIARARIARMQAASPRAQSEEPGVTAAGAGLPAAGAAPAGGGRTDVVSYAMQLIGTPYRWGGSSPDTGFDCSGFVSHVYGRFGTSLPHYTGAQWNAGTRVSRDQLQPGDLVFFDGLGHDGIYIGGGQFVHAPRTGDRVKVSRLDEGWYGSRYAGAVRPG